MPNKSPIFPIHEPQHFSDYGFDLQIDYFQVLEAARRQKKESSWRSIDSLHFKLQNRKKHWWWKNALFFLKWNRSSNGNGLDLKLEPKNRARASISGPVYVTESRCGSGSATPYGISSRTSSGPLETAYFSLRELNMEHQARASTSAMPIYLVT